MRLYELSWDEGKFGTGIPALDSQHREFLSLAKGILKLIGEGFVNGALHSAIDNLIAFARTHFEFEEKLMREHGYADTDNHVKEHLGLIDQLQTLKQNVPTGSSQKIRKELFTAFLIDLVELHLVHADGALPKLLAKDVPGPG